MRIIIRVEHIRERNAAERRIVRLRKIRHAPVRPYRARNVAIIGHERAVVNALEQRRLAVAFLAYYARALGPAERKIEPVYKLSAVGG